MRLRGAVARPFFLWVHFYDPHHPYVAPEPYARRFRSDRVPEIRPYSDAILARPTASPCARGATCWAYWPAFESHAGRLEGAPSSPQLAIYCGHAAGAVHFILDVDRCLQ